MLMKMTFIMSAIPLNKMPIKVPIGVAQEKMRMNLTIYENGMPLFCIAIEIDMPSANL